MTNGENQALATLKRWLPNVTEEQIVKKLGEEVAELALAVGKGDKQNIKEEIGDCVFILFHLLNRTHPDNTGIVTSIVTASEKLETKMYNGHYSKRTDGIN